MKLEDMVEIGKEYIKSGLGSCSVYVTLKEPSIGARASVPISSIISGFDWESGQIRIEPEKDLIRKEKDRDIPQETIKREIPNGDKVRRVRKCPVCGEIVKKDFRYCHGCGQRIFTESEEKQIKEGTKYGKKT